MAIEESSVAEKVFNILKGYGYAVKSYTPDGMLEIDPRKATRFAVAKPDMLVRVSAEDRYIYFTTSEKAAESTEDIRKALKTLAQEYMLNFDFGIFGKKISAKSDRVDVQRNREKMGKDTGINENSELDWYSDKDKYYDKKTGEMKVRDGAKKLRKPNKRDDDSYGNTPRNFGPTKARSMDEGQYSDNMDAHIAKLEAKPTLTKKEQMKLNTMKDYRAQRNKKGMKESIEDMSDAKLKYHAVKKFPHGRYTDREIKQEHERRRQAVPNYHTVKPAAESVEEEIQATMEGFGSMHGTSKTSYQPLDNVKVVVRHHSAVNEESRGARSRNIKNIYIQRGEERFKMAENNLHAARAMARHIYNGGEMFDSIGESITEMAKEQRELKEFVRYVNKAGIVNEDNEQYVKLAKENINHIRGTLQRLSGVKTYTNAVESLENMANVEISEDGSEIEDMFVETHFDEKVANAMTGIKRSVARKQKYQEAVESAIKNESFAGVRNMLSEDEGLEFSTPHAKLSYQVARMGDVAGEPVLRNHLHGISRKLQDGSGLDEFDYKTVKDSLMQARTAQPEAAPQQQTFESEYQAFLDQFDIL